MDDKFEERTGIAQIFERAIEQNPQNVELLRAFQPIVETQRSLALAPVSSALDLVSVDREKLKAGVPVIRQISLFSPEPHWKETAGLLVAAIKTGLPSIAEEIDNVFLFIQTDRLALFEYLQAPPEKGKELFERWVKELEVPPGPLSFLLESLRRVILEQRAKEITAALGELHWDKGYCPICGDNPSFALIEEKGGKRFLHCSSCGHDWRFTRVVCPCCENQAQQGMTYFYVEGKPYESAFICDKCGRYLVTLNRAAHIFDRDPDVSAMSLVHLDVLMQEKGYSPMTACIWNTLN